jgi:hypothetical protein
MLVISILSGVSAVSGISVLAYKISHWVSRIESSLYYQDAELADIKRRLGNQDVELATIKNRVGGGE